MTFQTMLSDQWTLGMGMMFLIASAALFSINKRQRDAVLVRLHFHRRRTSGASTPPRSFSPSKKSAFENPDSKEAASLPPAAPDYVNTFPPPRRSVLPESAKQTNSDQITTLLESAPSSILLREKALSTTRSYDLKNDESRYTPTGFSTEEIKALGDFPTYDILSGVPLPEPYDNFDPTKALPRPYRPFRWAYHQTMSLTKLEPNWWLEIENTYKARIQERQTLFAEHGSHVLDYLPGSELACKELMEMCLQFYCARYPTYFTLSIDKQTFHNHILSTQTDLKSMHPLHVLLHNVPEDFAIVLRNEQDGLYYFRAGMVCSSLGWNVGTKIGMGLREIHAPIPDYKEKMAFSMDRYFSKMPTNAPIQRGSWGLEVETPLYMPPGHPHEKLRCIQKEGLTIEECHLRVDWQTLRRLPLSAGVVFNFKGIFTPVREFRDEPYIPALLLKVMREGKRSLMEYKNTWHVEHVCVPAFEEFEREQVERGVVEEGWEVATLGESPFYPGWEEKWHRIQGF